MATLTATAAVASSSVAIRPFRSHKPSRAPAGVRCSVAEGPAISQPRAAGGGLVDCVVVGGGISGLCIAQALATKHRDRAPDVVVTEATDRVGGNITTVERDGYLWEEGLNSFQPFRGLYVPIPRFFTWECCLKNLKRYLGSPRWNGRAEEVIRCGGCCIMSTLRTLLTSGSTSRISTPTLGRPFALFISSRTWGYICKVSCSESQRNAIDICYSCKTCGFCCKGGDGQPVNAAIHGIQEHSDFTCIP
ncbi:uncharacterized protein LOC130134594 [Syzygium oleosum]|uniref:uncharacterized protein LOC130134594 n=1 Tax=Syzygium oleosum TaxID=219896 RepID=UPI0024BAA7FE|nr:uncharacterized protein LOC130134594 [Syzygium oleosum]